MDEKHLWIGNSPYSNLREVCRKMNDIFDLNIEDVDEKAFDNHIFEVSQELASKMIKDRGNNHFHEILPTELFSTDLRELFLSFYHKILKSYDKKAIEYYSIRKFYQSLKTFFHLKLETKVKKNEFYHLFLSFLSPLYVIDTQKILRDFKTLFTNKKGEIKNASLISKQNTKDRVIVELSTFDGIVKTKELIILGDVMGKKSDTSCQNRDHYYSWKNSLNFNKNIPLKVFEDHHYLFYSSSFLGTDCPFLEMTIKENHIEFRGAILKKWGDKLDFYRAELEERCFHSVSQLLPELKRNDLSNEVLFEYTFCKWLKCDQIRSKQGILNKVRIKRKNFSGIEGSTIKFNNQNIQYLGPLKDYRYGFLSCLLELKSLVNQAK